MRGDGKQTPIVVFDCDGVLLVSNRLKLRVFAETAAAAGFDADEVAGFERHVARSFGTSRYRMFDTLLASSTRVETTSDALAQAYGERLGEAYPRAPLTAGARPVLEGLIRAGLPLYVVSGSDQTELREIFRVRGLDRFFVEVFGSPTSKIEHLKSLMAQLAIEASDAARIVFVGDAVADWKAADAVGARFVYMRRHATDKAAMADLEARHRFPVIDDLRSLPAILAGFGFLPSGSPD